MNLATGKKQPEKSFRAGNIHVAIWKNESKEGKGFYSVSFEKHYKKDDKWHTTNNLNTNDIPKVILVLQEAYKHLNMNTSAKEILEDAEEEVYEQNNNSNNKPHQRFVEEEDVK